jgi:hypothetical protein
MGIVGRSPVVRVRIGLATTLIPFAFLFAVFLVGLTPCSALAQAVPLEYLNITAKHASTWQDGDTSIVQLEGPVSINGDTVSMTAQRAVVWLTEVPGTVLGQQHFEVALIGNAVLTQEQVTRSGDQLYVEGQVRGSIHLSADDRVSRDLHDSQLYQNASLLRPIANLPAGTVITPEMALKQRLYAASTRPFSPPAPATQPHPLSPISFSADSTSTFETADGKIAFLLIGHVVIFQNRANGDFLDMTAQRGVLFTPVRNLSELGESQKIRMATDAIDAAYLEGDVQLNYTPPFQLGVISKRAEQRLTGDRIYYDLTTDRAICTDAVIHTIDPARQVPVTIRAQVVRQLSAGEYKADKAIMSTSEFATPSYSINADKVYIRQTDTGDPRYGNRTDYVANDATLRAYGIPYFYFPVLSGSLTDRGTALRSLYTEDSSIFGVGVKSEWGLFETLGILKPLDLDAYFKADYYGDRGPGTGLHFDYQGGFITEDSKAPWDFQGDFDSYFVDDHGKDDFGADRLDVKPPNDLRGQVEWEHQHFFPDDWQVQLRLGWVSDATFMEQWFQDEFDEGLPHDLEAYVKHQKDTEAFTFLLEGQPLGFVTTSDQQQEQFEVERLPEVGYHRIGDSLGDSDQFTFFSDNTASGLHYKQSDVSLRDQGFAPGQTAGLPSQGQTGVTDDVVWRGDFREEVDYPTSLGPIKTVPFVVGRYTGYSSSPDDGGKNRLYAGLGVRASTEFWKVDDSAESELFDIHRIRHVLEPEVELMTAGETVNRDKLYIFDEGTDALNDASVAEIGLHQRWETKRGGPGQYRSVDFFTWNVEGDFYLDRPRQTDPIQNPDDFRGLFFPSEPEMSVARDSLNSDATWRLTDSTAILGEESYNLDHSKLATAALGINVFRDVRMSYYVGIDYIGTINSTVARIAAAYQVSAQYTFITVQAYDLTQEKAEESAITLLRHFDRFYASLTIFYNDISRQSGFQFGLIPEGLGRGVNTDVLQKYLQR